ncbi:MAG: N-acylglucosamine 2-epimerase superfamily [Hyphomicrobiales bacterium]|nr:N-acylglucosamine 2-epimerase superfamily [Hyphomicrobiales bacterium]
MSEGTQLAALGAASVRLTRWLFDDALPLWTSVGVDQGAGAFVEAISLVDGTASRKPRRCFVQPRQVYSLIEAGRLGWTGDWRACAARALDWHLASFRLPDGTFAHLADAQGAVLDARFDLYDQPFVLFGLAHAAQAMPERRAACEEAAGALLAGLRASYAHPERGFHESAPPAEPLRANPHMHLLEAALAWEDAQGGPQWAALADDLMELALTRLIDPRGGRLREFFDSAWAPLPGDRGRQIEPGHQFEWAWLAHRWASRRARPDALRAARRLFDVGAAHGVCPARKVAVLEINDDDSPRVPLARLWGQTEWLKAALALAGDAQGAERSRYLSSALDAVRATELFLSSAPPGLWRDKLDERGAFIDEPAPASSLYHLVCAIGELSRFCAKA